MLRERWYERAAHSPPGMKWSGGPLTAPAAGCAEFATGNEAGNEAENGANHDARPPNAISPFPGSGKGETKQTQN